MIDTKELALKLSAARIGVDILPVEHLAGIRQQIIDETLAPLLAELDRLREQNAALEREVRPEVVPPKRGSR